MLTSRQAAKDFVKVWSGKGTEKGQTQMFWLSFLRDVLGINKPEDFIDFEVPVKLRHTSYIDAYIRGTNIIIEQKSSDVNLRGKYRQSDGTYLTPFQQAKRYNDELAVSQKANYIVLCNFISWLIYDMEHPHEEPVEIFLDELPDYVTRFSFLVKSSVDVSLRKEEAVSISAGKIIGDVYDALLKEYAGSTVDDKILRQLNILCVRLVFCLYAEDAGLFGQTPDIFHDYLASFPIKRMRRALRDLFEILNTPYAARERFLEPELSQFPYVNGGLFDENEIEIPPINDFIAELILEKASLGFDWSRISPTIFGSVFESTLNPVTRREGGMHYTSVKNIHKVIDPLFLSGLTAELDVLLKMREGDKRNRLLDEFTTKLSGYKFLDPACGSGNFLTETYISLRRLENKALKAQLNNQRIMGELQNPIKVNISQFYGIEINDFAVTVARTALWIAEAQMFQETEKILQNEMEFFPLKSYPNIVEANALVYDWTKLISPADLTYIIGNPPFVGARMKTLSQSDDLKSVFSTDSKRVGELDYVAGWFMKTVSFIKHTQIKAAYVATNSITQGEQVAPLWTNIWKCEPNIRIDFAWRTFRWDNEFSNSAKVHVVIIGFSASDGHKHNPKIFDGSNGATAVANISPYIVNAGNILIEPRTKPLCRVPSMGIGNKPIDGGNYLFSRAAMKEFIDKEPASADLFRPWYGAEEFINGNERYCLWLGDSSATRLKKMPNVLERVKAVRKFRLMSKSKGTNILAETPLRFHVENMPSQSYMIVPRVSSEKRYYIPMGFMSPEDLCSDAVLIIPNADLYHFGILSSSVHMVWTKNICGRLEMRLRYSKDVVYNNFPWPDVDKDIMDDVRNAAEGILSIRNKHSDSTLGDLYNPLLMPVDLRNAHKELDEIVLKTYGLKHGSSEIEIFSCLLGRYEALLSNIKQKS